MRRHPPAIGSSTYSAFLRIWAALGASAAAVTGEFRAAQFGSEQYNSGMALTAVAKKLYRTLARVIPQCGMVSQAVAFNMFLAFFAVLLTALSLMKSSLEGEGGQKVAMRISAILPPGSWQLISAYVLGQGVNAWYLALIGWVGTLLVGSQVIKLIIKGIELTPGRTIRDPVFRIVSTKSIPRR